MSKLVKPLRKNVALAIDGGGIKGIMVARALMMLEEAEGKRLPEIFRLTAGTSTGAIIAAAIARGLNARQIHDLYLKLGSEIFRKSWRTLPFIRRLVSYQYSSKPFVDALQRHLGDITVGQIHRALPDFHMVLTATDIYASQTRFIKLYKQRYADWMLRDVVLASSTVPTYFPVVEHAYATPDHPAPDDEDWIPEPRYWVDGGVGSYSNPCYMAAYEIAFCLRRKGWRLDNTTLISIGTGRSPFDQAWSNRLGKRSPTGLLGPEWAAPIVETFLHDANDQQVRLVKHFFVDAVAERAGNAEAGLDFRRFNVNFDHPIEMDSARDIPTLQAFGEKLGQMILDDQQDEVGSFSCHQLPHAFSLRLPGDDISQVI